MPAPGLAGGGGASVNAPSSLTVSLPVPQTMPSPAWVRAVTTSQKSADSAPPSGRFISALLKVNRACCALPSAQVASVSALSRSAPPSVRENARAPPRVLYGAPASVTLDRLPTSTRLPPLASATSNCVAARAQPCGVALV